MSQHEDPARDPSSPAGAPEADAVAKECGSPFPPATMESVPEALRLACSRAGWANLMPVQSLALPPILDGRDVMIQSRTGSGKTGCYLLPALANLDSSLSAPQALILAPTRELAVQVEHEASVLFNGTDLRVAALYGGVGYGKQLQALRDGVHVIVGTPGRVLDHLLRRTLDLERLRFFVFDEADRMLSIGFYPDMKEIQRHLPRRRVHTCMFSATYPPHVLSLAEEFMREPIMLSLSQKEVHVAEVQHLFCRVKPMDKDRVLARLLETENPASAIIFCNTKANVHYVTDVLKGFGHNADELSADLSQGRREAVLEKIRRGRLQYLVATDVAARGIDIPALSHVFLYEPPEDRESYIHRAGRTGRAGAAGTVISLVDVMQCMELERIGRHYHIDLREIPAPEEKDAAEAVGRRLTTILEARFRALNGLERMRVARYLPLARALAGAEASQADEQAADGDDAMLLAMLLDECRRRMLQETFDMPTGRPEGGEGSQGSGRSGRRRRGRKDGSSGEARQDEAVAETRTDDAPRRERNDGDGENAPDAETASGDGAPRRRRRRRRSRRASSDGAPADGGTAAED